MRILMLMPLCLYCVASTGCIPTNQWHEENFYNQLEYKHPDAGSLRDDLGRTLQFLPTIGFKSIDEMAHRAPTTEAVFVRDMGDHFHVTVTVRGLADLSGSGWIMTVRVESYEIGQEGAIATGQALLKEIDDWHQRGVLVPSLQTIQPVSTAPSQ